MPAPRKCPDELRVRSQRLVREAREQEPDLSLNAAVKRIGPRVGINPDTLRGWCKQAEIDAGRRPGTTTTESARVKELEREVRELTRRVSCRLGGFGCVQRDAWDRPFCWSRGGSFRALIRTVGL